jgi:hypothetical protein
MLVVRLLEVVAAAAMMIIIILIVFIYSMPALCCVTAVRISSQDKV